MWFIYYKKYIFRISVKFGAENYSNEMSRDIQALLIVKVRWRAALNISHLPGDLGV